MAYELTSIPLRGLKNPNPFTGDLSSDYYDIAFADTEKMSLVNYASRFDFESISEQFIEYIKTVYKEDYTQFVESDLGMMFIDLIAYLGSMLAYKADALANEAYLPTVSTRNNARKILKLIGIDLKGPVAAKASATTTVANLSSGDEVTFNAQTVEIASNIDSQNLQFSLYSVDRTTGEINLTETSPTLDFLDFDENGTTTNLALVEGQSRTLEGTFASNDRLITITTPSVIEGSILVSSNEDGGTIYEEIDNLYLASATQPVFEKSYQDDYSCILLFGEGPRGKKPTVGADYVVFYRTGGGERGNVPREYINYSIPATITSLGGSETEVTVTIENSGAATGGRESETLDQVKKYAPYIFKSQHRCVTGEDYMAHINRFTGTQGGTVKGIAVLRDAGATANIIDVYTVEKASATQLARTSNALKSDLLSYLNQYKMLTDEIVIVDGLVRTVDPVLRLVVDKRYKTVEDLIKIKVTNSVLDFFNVDNTSFGEPLRFGMLQKKIFEDVPEVQYVIVENFDQDELVVNFNEIIQLNNLEINLRYIE